MDRVRIDNTTTPGTTYVGTCSLESSGNTSDAIWAISAVVESGGETIIKWAGGTKSEKWKWDDRASLTYS